MSARAAMRSDFLGSRGWGREVMPRQSHLPLASDLNLPRREEGKLTG